MSQDPADHGYRICATGDVPDAVKARIAAILADPEGGPSAGKATLALYDEGKPETGFLIVGDDRDAMVEEWLDTEGDDLGAGGP